jgi:membrane fusion protein, type I secretion system
MTFARIRDAWSALRRQTAPHVIRLGHAFATLRASVVGHRAAAATRPDAAPGEIALSLRGHMRAIVLIALFLAFSIGVLGAATHLSGAVIAAGSLVVESNVKRVQHPTGGIVGELRVHDGSRVGPGDLLLRLDPTEAQANYTAITKALWELEARRARLEAERDEAGEVAFPPELLGAGGDGEVARVIGGERKLFELRRAAQHGQESQLRERIGQLKEEVAGLTEQAQSKAQEIVLVNKELGGVRELYEKNLVPISKMTALERDAARLAGERGLLNATNAQTRGKISEIELQIIQLGQNLRSDVAKELADIRAKASELTEKKITAAELLKRIDVRSPQAGVVQDLSVHARGAVVAAGEQIMLIVPEADDLIVEVKLNPADIDKVALHQRATLRFTSFNARSTPELFGTVTRIAADTTKDDKAGAYYLVRVSIETGETERLGGHRLVPGMPVEAFIRTGERSVLSYVLKPLTDQAMRAFREN